MSTGAAPQPTQIDIELDRASPTPLYHQVARELERAISDGRLGRGDFLANELALAEQWQVSRITLRRSIQELVEAGLLVRRRGVGTQVVNDQLPQARLVSLYEDLAERGLRPTTQVLRFETVVPDDRVNELLGQPPGSSALFVERCRFADGKRLAIMRNWLILDVAPDLSVDRLESDGLYRLLRAGGTWPHCVTRRVSARVAGEEEAGLLEVAVGDPILALESRMQDRSGRRVEVSEQIYDGNAYTMEMSIVDH